MVFIIIIIIIIAIIYYFILVYFDRLPLNVFHCDWCPSLCCLILFCLFPHWGRVHGWVVDTAGQGGGSILQGLGCWPTVGLFNGHLTSTCDECC